MLIYGRTGNVLSKPFGLRLTAIIVKLNRCCQHDLGLGFRIGLSLILLRKSLASGSSYPLYTPISHFCFIFAVFSDFPRKKTSKMLTLMVISTLAEAAFSF